MEGKCISDWYWTCGWHLARYERGEYTVLEVPQDCAASLIIPYLPPVQVQELVDALMTLCRIVGGLGGGDIQICFSNNQTGTMDYGFDSIIEVLIVFVHPDIYTAQTLRQVLSV